jgi:pyridinium-3,5-biscarboxylic acid mononucleotide sulfurtransferase
LAHDELEKKLDKLTKILAGLDSALVAFSGGVDSTLLLAVARQLLKNKVKAATAVSPTFPKWEKRDAERIAKQLGVKHIMFNSDELELEQFCANPKNRCYFCKKELFTKLKQIAKKESLKYVIEASNTDDLSDFRPGRKAIAELKIKSPLLEAGLSKAEVRAASKKLGLPTFDKPSFACLASRFQYGEQITRARLKQVERAENLLRELGFKVFRVRFHGEVARLELDQQGMTRLLADKSLREKIYTKFRSLGFDYTALDLLGYRSGSMNLWMESTAKK